MRTLLLLVLLVLALAEARRPSRPSLGGGSRMIGEMYEFRECNASYNFHVVNWTQRHAASGDILVDANFVLTRSTPSLSGGKVVATKCSEYSTNCEHVVTVPFGRQACSLWDSKHMFWTPVKERLKAVQPPHHTMGCPFKEGDYGLRDTAIDFDSMARLCPYPLEHSVWTTEVQAHDADGRPFICFIFRGKVIRWIRRPAARP